MNTANTASISYQAQNEIIYNLTQDEIEWESDGDQVIDSNFALAFLMINSVVKINPVSSLPEVLCINDFIDNGKYDSEPIEHSDIEKLYKMFIQDPLFGPTMFCCMKRNKAPSKKISKRITDIGIWDINKDWKK